MHERKIRGIEYWNNGEHAIAVVVVANYWQGKLADWAAYIGVSDETYHEEDAYEEAAAYGEKLYGDTAEFFTRYYRDMYPMDLYRH